MLLHSGDEEENVPYTKVVVLMLSKEARNAPIGLESHGSRITKASFKTKKEGVTMNIIQSYAPTNDSNDNDKDKFYEKMQSMLAKYSGKDLLILTGDLNAKVAMDNNGYEDIMGQHELIGRNEWKYGEICKSMGIQQIGYRWHNIPTRS
ncbi:unnamed protein product [Schistosoma mattheei]|uniref:Uncharacterized protein n=1 Tax=Schistosoma mattheei TaxID=31246 RepID=A0A183PB66_9TREM|nr:unnamed protein product [Schistosoma mattheei]